MKSKLPSAPARSLPRSGVIKPGPVERNRENEQNVTYELIPVIVTLGPVSHRGTVYATGQTLSIPLPGALNLIAQGRVAKAP